MAATFLTPVHWALGVDELAGDFAGKTSRSIPEVDAEEAPKAVLEDGVDGEGWCTVHDLDDGDPDSHCRILPSGVDHQRVVARSRNRKVRSA